MHLLFIIANAPSNNISQGLKAIKNLKTVKKDGSGSGFKMRSETIFKMGLYTVFKIWSDLDPVHKTLLDTV